MNDSLIQRLVEDEASGRYSRRQILQRAAAIGLSAPAVAAIFAGAIPVRALAQGADNPLGVDPAAPLDVVIFKGGFGDDYAIYVNDNMYKKLYPDAQITCGSAPMGDFEVSINPNVVKTTSKSNITPEPAWARLLDFETRLPRAVERLVNR